MTQEFKGKWSYLENELVCVRGDQSTIIAFGKVFEADKRLVKLLPYTASLSTPIKNELKWVEEGEPYGIDGDIITSIQPTATGFIQNYIQDYNRYGEAQRNIFLISELENSLKLEGMQKDKNRKIGLS